MTTENTNYSTPPLDSEGKFHQIHQIYYGTDDGFAELRPREELNHDAEHIEGLYKIFNRFGEFHRSVSPERANNIHLLSVVGGLYGLNLIPLFQPREITFFDINPHAVVFFELIRRVWLDSGNSGEFLNKLKHVDYKVNTEQERIISHCIAARQKGTLTEEYGRSARSLLSSWRYALDNFDLTRQILSDVPVHTLVDTMESRSFSTFVAEHENLWIYCSNIMLFSFFDLEFNYPQNAVLIASYYDQIEILDLGEEGDGPLTIHCCLPMSSSK